MELHVHVLEVVMEGRVVTVPMEAVYHLALHSLQVKVANRGASYITQNVLMAIQMLECVVFAGTTIIAQQAYLEVVVHAPSPYTQGLQHLGSAPQAKSLGQIISVTLLV
jgi:hypothetical protein